MATCDLETAAADSVCFECAPVDKLAAMSVSLLCKVLQALDPMATCDPETIADDAKCFECFDLQKLMAIQAKLLCDISENIGGGGAAGTGCVLCDDSDPVEAPTDCSCALWYNYSNTTLWFWRSDTSTWVQLIS